MTAANWGEIIDQANEELKKENKKKGAADGLLDHGDGFDAWAIDLGPEWQFAEKTRFMYKFLISNLSTKLHGKTIGIEARNGLELYRQVVQAVDDIPENAKLRMGATSR